MPDIALEEINTKPPEKAEPGDVVKTKDGEFVKIKDRDDENGRFFGEIEIGKNDGEVEIPIDVCQCAMSPHQFGQAKRFHKKGTGFSSQGRKLKYPRNDLFSDVPDSFFEEKLVEDFVNGEIEGEELLTKERSTKQVAGIIVTAFEYITDGFKPKRSNVNEFIRNYETMVGMNADCDQVAEDLSKNLETYFSLRSLDDNDINNLKKWVRNNLSDVWCPD